MSIWANKGTRLMVQGITGSHGRFHALACRDYGTKVVAGVTPGKGGQAGRAQNSEQNGAWNPIGKQEYRQKQPQQGQQGGRMAQFA